MEGERSVGEWKDDMYSNAEPGRGLVAEGDVISESRGRPSMSGSKRAGVEAFLVARCEARERAEPLDLKEAEDIGGEDIYAVGLGSPHMEFGLVGDCSLEEACRLKVWGMGRRGLVGGDDCCWSKMSCSCIRFRSSAEMPGFPMLASAGSPLKPRFGP